MSLKESPVMEAQRVWIPLLPKPIFSGVGDKARSPTFVVGNLDWCIEAEVENKSECPNESDKKVVGLFLRLESKVTGICVRFRIVVVGPNGDKDAATSSWYTYEGQDGYGFEDFMDLETWRQFANSDGEVCVDLELERLLSIAVLQTEYTSLSKQLAELQNIMYSRVMPLVTYYEFKNAMEARQEKRKRKDYKKKLRPRKRMRSNE